MRDDVITITDVSDLQNARIYTHKDRTKVDGVTGACMGASKNGVAFQPASFERKSAGKVLHVACSAEEDLPGTPKEPHKASETSSVRKAGDGSDLDSSYNKSSSAP